MESILFTVKLYLLIYISGLKYSKCLQNYNEVLLQYHIPFLNPLLHTCNFRDCFWCHHIMIQELLISGIYCHQQTLENIKIVDKFLNDQVRSILIFLQASRLCHGVINIFRLFCILQVSHTHIVQPTYYVCFYYELHLNTFTLA